jgi:toxin ParE1/3/4
MARLRYSAEARDDLDSIAAYIADRSGNRTAAKQFANELRRRCRELASSPIRMGRSRPELRMDLRSIPYKNYSIFFRYVGDVVEIMNVIEGHRDMQALFRKNEH